MMGDLFRGAKNVVAWLGQAYHDKSTDLDHLNKSGLFWDVTILLGQHLCQANASCITTLLALYN